jgi:hypothetical protein
MSFGFGIGDFLAVYDKCRYIYECLKTGPTQVRELAEQFDTFKNVVNNLKNITRPEDEEVLKRKDEAAFDQMKEQLATISKDAKKTLEQINSFIEKYGGDGKWHKLKAAMNIEEIPGLRSKLTINYLAIIEFQTGLAARLGVRTSIDVHALLADVQFLKKISLATFYLVTQANTKWWK